MPNAARLSGVGTFFAFEFDDNTKTSFSVSADSTVYASNIDETAYITTSESLSSISVPTTASFNDGRSSHTLTGLLAGDTIIYAVAYQISSLISSVSIPTDFVPAFQAGTGGYIIEAGQHLYKGTSGSYTITGITTNNLPTVIGVFRNVGGNLDFLGTSTNFASTYPRSTTNRSASEGDLLLSIGAAAWDGGTISAPSNFTLVGDSVSNNVHTMMAYRVVPSDGSYNGGTFSGTNPVASDPNDITMFIFRILDSEPPPALRVENDGEIKLNSRDTSIINEVDTFDDIPTSNLELHLDASSGFTTTTLPTSWQDLSGNNRHMKITGDTNVSLLLNGNGSNGSTTITDSSTYNHSITVSGNAQISTAQSKFGGSSMLFDGNGDYVRATDSSEFAFGTGDFTVEAWLRGTGNFYETRTSISSAPGFGFAVTNNTIKIWDGQGGSYIYDGSTTYDWTNWHHVAISRSGTTLRVFIDGSLDGTATTSRNLTHQGAIVGVNINRVINGFGGDSFNGYIDDLRITKGVARYTSNFTPPGIELSVYWSPTDRVAGTAAQSSNNSYALLQFASTIQVGQSVVIPEIPAISGVGTFTYDLFNGSGILNLSVVNGNVSYNSVTQSPVVGPIGPILGTREFFKFGGSNFQGIQHTTLRIPPQQVPYNAIKLTHINDGTSIFPQQSSSINNERGSFLNIPFESSDSRLGVCDGTGSASAYTGVTGTAARTVIVGVKVPASPSTSHTLFSYGANSAGQRFNIRLQSTGVIQIQFGSSYVNIPVSAIDDRNDFLVIAVTVPANATVSDVRVWLNGNEVTSQLIVSNGSTSINTSSANNVTIGGGSHGTVEYLDDSVITKVMMYSSVLSDLEIKQIYQSIIPDIYPFVERAS